MHVVRNEGSVKLVNVVVTLVPAGAATGRPARPERSERRVVELAPPRARNQCERCPVHALEPSVRAFARKNPLPTRMHRHDLVACPAVLLPKA